jgi:hypothetical protein
MGVRRLIKTKKKLACFLGKSSNEGEGIYHAKGFKVPMLRSTLSGEPGAFFDYPTHPQFVCE